MGPGNTQQCVRKIANLKGFTASPKLHLSLYLLFIAFSTHGALSFVFSRQRHCSTRTCPLTGPGVVVFPKVAAPVLSKAALLENADFAGPGGKRI
jgi:hypothetical protein